MTDWMATDSSTKDHLLLKTKRYWSLREFFRNEFVVTMDFKNQTNPPVSTQAVSYPYSSSRRETIHQLYLAAR